MMDSLAEKLCLQCGLCCNGVLFADVRREGDDHSPLFKQFGAQVPQPCPAFNSNDCKCALYENRPARCHKFECKQFIAARAEKISVDVALKKISETKKIAANVENLLRRLGFNDLKLPFSKRFQNCQRAAERGKISPENLEILADLQLAVHQLNAMLARDFYAR